jgi:hypothetical protein
MRVKIILGAFLCMAVVSLSGQIYTPGGAVQTNTGGTNVGVNEPTPEAKLHVDGGQNSCTGALLIDAYESDQQGPGEEPDPEEGGVLEDYCTTPYALEVKRYSPQGIDVTTRLKPNGQLTLGSGLLSNPSVNTFLSTSRSIGTFMNQDMFVKLGYLTHLSGTSGLQPQLVWKHSTPASSAADLLFSFNDYGQSNYKEVLRLTPAGIVGINTSNFGGDYKLYVGGKILCEELTVKLQQDWPDFVFKNDYKRMPLNELSLYIEQNGHLPNVPTAEEVSENGVNVGEMNAILLQKVEELTLEIIELNKKVEALSKASSN